MSGSVSRDGNAPILPPGTTNPAEEMVNSEKIEENALNSDAVSYPSTQKRVLIMIALYLAMFLVTLDQNIISTAIPRITDEFHSLNDIAWYGTAYLLTTCSFQLLMGKIYKFYPAKPVFLTCVMLFEVGSAICGAAPNSNALVVGRAIAGLGASGLFSGLMVIMFHTIPLQQRPMYQGAFGAIFAIGSVVGPLVGGTFVDKATWRWCFYINLPIGAVSIIVTMLLVHLPNQQLEAQAAGWKGKLAQLDPIGNLVFFPGIVCLVLALQWGGTVYTWDNARVIVLFILFGILSLTFIGIQIWKQDDGALPPRIMKQRSIAACVWFAFFNGGAMVVMLYYLPLWFQAIKGVSALKSGIMILPTILAVVFATISSGIIISKIGYYTPFFILCSIIMPIGAGLITTFTPTTGHTKWIGYQVIFGVGLGFGAQQQLNVVQTVLGREDIATGAAVVTFVRFLGSAIFLPIAQTVFLSSFISSLKTLPAISPSTVTGNGATELRGQLSGDDLNTLLADYNAAIVNVFYLVMATSTVTIFGSICVEWRSLKARVAEQAKGSGNSNKEVTEMESV